MIDIKDTDTDLQIRIKRWMDYFGWTEYRLQQNAGLSASAIRGMHHWHDDDD